MKSEDNIRYLKGVGEKRAELFRQLGVVDVGTLLSLYPRDYRNRTKPLTLREAYFDRPCCIKATVISEVKEAYVRKGMVIYHFIINDGEENCTVKLFNQKYLAEKIEFGKTYLFYGKIERNFIKCELSSPEIYDESENTIMPIYPATAGLNSNAIRKVIGLCLEQYTPDDPLPLFLREKYGLCDLKTALNKIHFPAKIQDIEIARKRLVFEELFFLQMGILFQKSDRAKHTDVIIKGTACREFAEKLPFTLTDAQKSAINDCVKDMRSGKPMSRLVQGDVGSGKTMVAAALSYAAAKEGYQSVIMAPTEVLANQHFKNLSRLFENTDIKIASLTGSVTKANKLKIKEALALGNIDVLIGTHAVLENDVNFKKLGLVVTDEQHRFGVEQRTVLSSKGNNPHMLVMSATPIPRTMSLIFYGDLDISIIDSLPSGRQPIKTYLISPEKRTRAFDFIKEQLNKGRQGYIVCPAVEENETTNLASATEYYENLRDKDFASYKVGLIHGKMKPKEKDAVMKAFSLGEVQLLIATTVIEVGVDVPNATVMLIENAERFGLSQLHQLRGRIGRGAFDSTCIFISSYTGGDAGQRLKFMCNTLDGFKIADEDLRVRGPGDFIGKRQHGLPELKIADLSEDMELFRAAGLAAKELHSSDPNLVKSENACLKTEIHKLFNNVKTYGYN